MPRAEDIAWKFVIKLESKKWRCPYCENEYSGSVPRVRSHFLKQPKEGISSCKKVPEHISMLMKLLHNQVLNKEDMAWKFVDRLEDNKWRCHYCSKEFYGDLTGVKVHLLKVANEGISICTEVPDHIRTLMQLLLDEVAEEQSREACGQTSVEPQSLYVLPQAEVAEEQSREACGQTSVEPQSLYVLPQAEVAEEESREANGQFSTIPQSRDMPSPAVPFSPLSFGYDIDYFLATGEPATDMANFTSDQERQFQETLAMRSLAQNSHGESIPCSTMTLVEAYLLDLPDQSQCSILFQMQMNDQQTPVGASSFQYDQLPTVDNSNCVQDCNQCSQFQTSMDIDPLIAQQHTGDSHIIEATMVDSQVPEAATNTTGLSSAQDMNRASPIIDVRNISAKYEEIRNLKRKVEELNDKEAVIKEQMEIESAASSVQKKRRILVERWLKETERARNNFQIIGQASAETLRLKEQVETLTREVEELIEQTTLLIEARDVKGDEFLVWKPIGEAIHGNIELIWDHLKENRPHKLGIYGMGGVGKTTIVMYIHNRLLEDATFDGVGFITVSHDFSNDKLQSDICKALKFDDMEDEHEKKRAAKLSKRLERKKNCVLILDDVWRYLDLEGVGIPVRADGFKLVLTTRSYEVCRQMQCQEMIKIEPLSQEEAKSLFFKELGSKVPLYSEIEAVVESIVRECAGLPIGVITMARSMRGVTDVFEWRDSLVKLKESSMGQTDMENKVLMNLKFSYDRLGDPSIQQYFLSCALYPEDRLIDKFELVEFFIDQGLIDELSKRKEQYDRGLTILNKLGNVCLLEDHGRKMKMHDLIRDMALHIISVTSIVEAGKSLMRIPSEKCWTDALQKVSLMRNNIRAFPLDMSPNCPKLSTLLLENAFSHDAVIPDSFFKNLLGLKVLNLSRCYLTELPNSISDLVNLRALLLSRCRKLRHIPYIGKLISLRKLDASGCESLEALEGLEKLVNLRYLDLTSTCIKRLPTGTLERLLNLQYLKVSAVIEEDITKLEAMETIRCYLENADYFNRFLRVIEHSDHLYKLQVDLKKSEFIVKVGEKPDKPIYWVLKRFVDILGWSGVGGEYTGIFNLAPRDVQRLKMTKCDGMTSLSDIGPLEHLEMLEIHEWENLGVLCGGQDEEVIDIHDSPVPTPTPLLFANLRSLNISKCPKMKYLFGHGFKSNLPHLRQILIRGCIEMVGIIAAVTSPPPHPLPAFLSLESIFIFECGKMKRAVEFQWIPHFPNLRRIEVHHCEKIEEIIGGPSPCMPVEKISLESLSASSCYNMRKLFPHDLLLHLQNLQTISVFHCEGMVEMISGAGQGQEGSITTPVNNTLSSFQPSISLPNLRELDLDRLPQLKSICEVPISCGSMDILTVYECPELKGIPLQLRLRGIDIKDLPHIWVEDEEKWKMLMWDDPNAQAILQPYLRKRGSYRFPNAIELDAKGKDLPRRCS